MARIRAIEDLDYLAWRSEYFAREKKMKDFGHYMEKFRDQRRHKLQIQSGQDMLHKLASINGEKNLMQITFIPDMED